MNISAWLNRRAKARAAAMVIAAKRRDRFSIWKCRDGVLLRPVKVSRFLCMLTNSRVDLGQYALRKGNHTIYYFYVSLSHV